MKQANAEAKRSVSEADFRRTVGRRTEINLYNAFVRPHLIYSPLQIFLIQGGPNVKKLSKLFDCGEEIEAEEVSRHALKLPHMFVMIHGSYIRQP